VRQEATRRLEDVLDVLLRFLGACLIDVSAQEADACELDVLLQFPLAQPGSEWIAAATQKAHRLGCNPGGQIAFAEIEPTHPGLRFYEMGKLMDRATIDAISERIAAAGLQ
jgi:hypothetical protein